MSKIKDRVDIRYGRLIVVEFIGLEWNFYTNYSLWKCRCDCGNIITVQGNYLQNGHTKSCGCLHREKSSQRTIKRNKEMHMFGKSNPNYMHGKYTKVTFDLKEKIRKRDNYICQECGKTQDECDRILDVHHIDGDNANNIEENMITLCRNCHTKLHNERGY